MDNKMLFDRCITVGGFYIDYSHWNRDLPCIPTGAIFRPSKPNLACEEWATEIDSWLEAMRHSQTWTLATLISLKRRTVDFPMLQEFDIIVLDGDSLAPWKEEPLPPVFGAMHIPCSASAGEWDQYRHSLG